MVDDPRVEIYFDASSSAVELEMIEISHPSFSQVFRFVRNVASGIMADIGTGEGPVQFDYLPYRASFRAARQNLSAGLTIDIGDVGEVIPNELNRVHEQNTGHIKPTLRYWEFKSTDLTQPSIGPFVYEVVPVIQTEEGSRIEASPPNVSDNRTGITYTSDRIAMLRAFQ